MTENRQWGRSSRRQRICRGERQQKKENRKWGEVAEDGEAAEDRD